MDRPEPGHMPRLIVWADGVKGLDPGRQDFPGGRVEVVPGGFVPDRQMAAVVLDLGSVGQPDLVVGRGKDDGQDQVLSEYILLPTAKLVAPRSVRAGDSFVRVSA